MITIYCDGGARGNPGPAASAFVVYENSKEIYKASKYLGSTTNNVAEYNAVILALTYLSENELKDGVVLILDSELVTKQMNGLYKVKNENLKNLFLKARQLEKNISTTITYKWSERANNKIADALVNKELDAHKR